MILLHAAPQKFEAKYEDEKRRCLTELENVRKVGFLRVRGSEGRPTEAKEQLAAGRAALPRQRTSRRAAPGADVLRPLVLSLSPGPPLHYPGPRRSLPRRRR